jgi:hypothetical protein
MIRVVLLIAVSASVLCGCSTFSNMMPATKEAKVQAQRVHDMQQRVMRFADAYAGGVSESVGRFQKGTITAEERLSAQSWKLQQAESAYTIASGPNSVANALDMVVLATLSRMVLEDLWLGEAYGERARPVLDTHERLEQEAWVLVADVLTPEQQARVKEIIDEWRRKNPQVRAVGYIHFSEFAKTLSGSADDKQKSESLFSLLRLDPFNSLDPAVREITETRQLAERSIFYLQRAPGLLDMQIERTSYAFAVMPETKALLADMQRFSYVGSAADRLVTTLPETLSHERKELIAQLMSELEMRREAIGELTENLRTTLVAGTDTANALRTTLDSFDRISARFAAKPGAADSREKGPPFDIRQYTEMVRELAATTRELNALAARVDGSLPVVSQATENAAARMEGLTNYLFWRLALLLVIAVVLTTAAALTYRVIVVRIREQPAA